MNRIQDHQKKKFKKNKRKGYQQGQHELGNEGCKELKEVLV